MMNEDLFVQSLTKLFKTDDPSVLDGIGDDTAVLDFGLPGGWLFLAAADQVVEKVHFTPETSPYDAGVKLVNRNISDIAAMGGIPVYALLTVAVKPFDEQKMLEFHKGVADTAAKYHVSVIGGDMAGLPENGFVGSLTILGKVEKEKLCLRANAKDGDFLYATGCYGNSFHSGHHLHFLPRVEQGRFIAGTYSNAAMDVTDSLYLTAQRMAEASGLAVVLETENIPLREGADLASALTEGEDYELLFAVRQENALLLEQNWPFPDVKLSRVGRFQNGAPGTVTGVDAGIIKTGYDHFHESH